MLAAKAAPGGACRYEHAGRGLTGGVSEEEKEKESERPSDLLETVRTISSRAAPARELWFPHQAFL